MFKFNLKYFLLALLLFVIEVLIALYVHDNFIRPYIGDVLVVILIYCFLLSFLGLPKIKTAIGVLVFAFIVESLQYLNIVYVLGLEKSKLARIIIGTSFAWEDIIAYIAGILIVLMVELISKPKS
jgi:hypothetical protein